MAIRLPFRVPFVEPKASLPEKGTTIQTVIDATPSVTSDTEQPVGIF